ncbi:FAAR115Cp [Eremothecium gossypii FDAG1]|nr:FAAR115Cp [Eremothecium gossypii FDAG1]
MAYQLADIKQALQCVSSNMGQKEKASALQYLEQFQKTTDAWQLCHSVLAGGEGEALEIQVFAAQTLRNKVTYDLNQLEESLGPFKESLLQLLVQHQHRLIVTQLSVTIARLSIQYLAWRNPIGEIISVLNPYPDKLLGFLKILPEETLDMKSTPLSEDEFKSRTHELINQIAEDVLSFLIKCIDAAQDTGSVQVEQILSCLSTWIYEFPIEQLLTVTPLINLVFRVLMESHDDYPDAFEAAVDCLSVLLRETRDVANVQMIQMLYEQLMQLQSRLLPPVEKVDDWSEYEDVMDALTRLFVEAGESWCVFIGKEPQTFKPLVQVILLLTCKNTDLDVVKYTFPFWFNLKQMLVLARYNEQKLQYQDIYVGLINGIIKHLEYPEESFTSKEEEDKYREFRYDMGDVLKDCTAVAGPENALSQPFQLLKSHLALDASNIRWQKLEAPLFSLRTMGQEIPTTENNILPQIFQMLCNLPEHPKLRYAVTLVLGRYTEWTSKHSEFLEMELNYIFNGFQTGNNDKDLFTASSHALMYFCQDCSSLLSGYVEQLISFTWKIEPMVDMLCMFEVCQGLSSVINEQPLDKLTYSFELFYKPNSEKLQQAIEVWKGHSTDNEAAIKVADLVDLLFALFESLRPRYEYPSQGAEPLVPYIKSLWLTLSDLLNYPGCGSNTIIVERVMKLLRRLFEKYHVFLQDILPAVVDMLAKNYAETGLGSYLWCSGSLIYVFGDDESYPVPPELKNAVWLFACSQCGTFLENFAKINPSELDLYFENIQDFFLMMLDVLMFYPKQFITTSALVESVADCALSSVDKLNNFDSYITVIRCLDEILSWGFPTPPISTMEIETVPMEWRANVLNVMVLQKGGRMVSAIVNGLTSNLNSNAHPEAIGLLVKLFKLATQANNDDPSICMQWLSNSLEQLRPVSANEKNKLMSIGSALTQGDYRRVRTNIKDFIGWYLRKHVSPRLYK